MSQDYWNAEAITKSLDSYKAAFLEILELCPNVKLYGGGCPPVDVLKGQIEPAWDSKCPGIIEHATGVYVHTADLFSYGRPKDITHGTWLWGSDFFGATIYVERTWHSYGWAHGVSRREEDGSITRIKDKTLEAMPRTLRLTVDVAKYGLKDWKAKAAEIRGRLDTCRDESVRQAYIEAVDKADAEVNRWLEAINRKPVTLPEPVVAA